MKTGEGMVKSYRLSAEKLTLVFPESLKLLMNENLVSIFNCLNPQEKMKTELSHEIIFKLNCIFFNPISETCFHISQYN